MGIMDQLLSVFFSEHCYDEFFMKFNFFDVECLKQTISKGLGAGIIVGSTLVKIPQILKILAAKSSEGISFMSVLLELFAVTSAASYSFAKGYPFSSWGEAVFLLIETAIIGFLVLLYGGFASQANAFAALYSVSAYVVFSGIVPLSVLWSMQIVNVPIIVCAKDAARHFCGMDSAILHASVYFVVAVISSRINYDCNIVIFLP